MSLTVLTAVLPDYISYESSFHFEWSTDVFEAASGAVTANANWADYRLAGDLSSPAITQATLLDIIELFHICKGRAYGFLMKFWGDYAVTTQAIGTGDALDVTFQLVKTYTYGGYTSTRNLYKPKTGTTKIYLDAVELVGGWTVSLTTGVVTFDAAPGMGVAITADCEFYYPMMFDTDKLSTQWLAYEVGKATIPVIEVLALRIAIVFSPLQGRFMRF